MKTRERLLEIRDLSVRFKIEGELVTAVDSVSLHVGRGETVALVGESGCGKSMTSLAIMGLVPDIPGKSIAGSIVFEGADLLKKTNREMQAIRGRDVAMIFQEPMTSLNPVFTCGAQIVEAIRKHRKISAASAKDEAIQLLDMVGIPMPQARFGEYPHQMSGGMRQRVMIAMALSSSPKLLIADEPTTALDVTIQAQILDLLRDLQRDLDMAILLITHDLGVVAEMVERVMVMYAGRIVERAPCEALFASPKHPYTSGLLRSLPKLDVKEEELYAIPGTVPTLRDIPAGCPFHPRCERTMDVCRREVPPRFDLAGARAVACWLFSEDAR